MKGIIIVYSYACIDTLNMISTMFAWLWLNWPMQQFVPDEIELRFMDLKFAVNLPHILS